VSAKTNMSSIFDIEEKSNNEVTEYYLINNGWRRVCINYFGWVYMKNIRHKNRPSRFIRFYYHLDSFPKQTLRNMNNQETIKVHDIMTFELQVSEWITDWENNATPLFEYF
jgi:hypothetical protein